MTSLERIFWFYTRLKEERRPSRSQYIEEFEVSTSTFKRDLEFMRYRLGVPIEYDLRQNGYRLTDHSFELPAFWFNRPQMLMIIGVAKQLDNMAGETPWEISQLRDRISDLLTLQDGSRVHDLFSFENVEWARYDCRHIDLIMQAMLENRCLSLVYHAAHDNQVKERTVEPYRLHNYMGSWYLIAYCRFRGQQRIFQLGRIRELGFADNKFQDRKFDVDSFIASAFGIFKGDLKSKVVLRFDSLLARFINNEVWHADQTIEEHEDGSLTLAVPVADLTEVRMKVLKYGSHVEVLEPEELQRQVEAEARSIVDLYKKK